MMLIQQVSLFCAQYPMKKAHMLIALVLLLFIGEYSRKLFCTINTILMDFGIGGIVQPILVSAALVASPVVSALLVVCMFIWPNLAILFSTVKSWFRCIVTSMPSWLVRYSHVSLDCSSIGSRSRSWYFSSSTNCRTRLSIRILLSGFIARSFSSFGVTNRTEGTCFVPPICRKFTY